VLVKKDSGYLVVRIVVISYRIIYKYAIRTVGIMLNKRKSCAWKCMIRNAPLFMNTIAKIKIVEESEVESQEHRGDESGEDERRV
jgi:hypothetical protein